MKKIDCLKCKKGSTCCRMGAWVDLEEARRIVPLGLQGDFFHFEEDDDFPSGYKVGTSYEDEPCSFLTPDGLCAIHTVDYALKPTICKEFPYENGRLADFADVLCVEAKSRIRQQRKKKR